MLKQGERRGDCKHGIRYRPDRLRWRSGLYCEQTWGHRPDESRRARNCAERIRINAVCPAVVETSMADRLFGPRSFIRYSCELPPDGPFWKTLRSCRGRRVDVLRSRILYDRPVIGSRRWVSGRAKLGGLMAIDVECVSGRALTGSRACYLFKFSRSISDSLRTFLRTMGFSRLENSFSGVLGQRGTPHVAIGTAGLPCTIVIAGTDLVTTLPAVTTAPSPICTSGRIMTPGPMKAFLPILMPLVGSCK